MRAWHGAVAGVSSITEPLHCRGGSSDAFCSPPPPRWCFASSWFPLRYCPTCKNDTSEVVKAGEKLKASKKKAKMPSATTESQRDWGKVTRKTPLQQTFHSFYKLSRHYAFSAVISGVVLCFVYFFKFNFRCD